MEREDTLEARFDRDMREPLCDELREALVDLGDIRVLRHPLVVEIAPIGGVCNRRLAHKRALLESPRYARPSKRIWLYERPFRLDLACGWIAEAGAISDDLRGMLVNVWMDMESDDSDPDIVEMAVAAFRRAGFITQDESLFASPDDCAAAVIYRGGDNPKGMGWSTDVSVAEWFAAREARKGTRGKVWRARVEAAGALAYLSERNEYEIVCDPEYIRDARRIQ